MALHLFFNAAFHRALFQSALPTASLITRMHACLITNLSWNFIPFIVSSMVKLLDRRETSQLIDFNRPGLYCIHIAVVHKARRPHTSTMAPIRNYMWGLSSQAKLAALVALAFLTRLALQERENGKKICCKKFMNVWKKHTEKSLAEHFQHWYVLCTSKWWTYFFFLAWILSSYTMYNAYLCYWTWIWSVALSVQMNCNFDGILRRRRRTLSSGLQSNINVDLHRNVRISVAFYHADPKWRALWEFFVLRMQ